MGVVGQRNTIKDGRIGNHGLRRSALIWVGSRGGFNLEPCGCNVCKDKK